ncbi:MAG: DUF5069 domain-containing protein [Candidatus Eremiobacteraeota bacterium]|nr:DUF5069 domain-containing protein [Candidatus Eremiobacteraeota bacterium]
MSDRVTDLPYPDADLRAHPPRGARAMLGGLYFLPRTIDKARAKIQGALGLYKVSPGLSGYLLEWLGVSEDDFTEAVRTRGPTRRSSPGSASAPTNQRILRSTSA